MPLSIETPQIISAISESNVRMFGHNNAATRWDNSIIWPEDTATYPWPLTADFVTISSDDLGDVGLMVQVHGLNQEGYEVYENVTIAATPVTLENIYFRINKAMVITPTANAGKISIIMVTETLLVIPAEVSISQQLIYTVPVDKMLLISNMILSTSLDKDAEFRFFARNPNTPFSMQANFFIQNDTIQLFGDPYTKVGPLSDLYISVHSSKAGMVSAQMMGYLYPDKYNHELASVGIN